MLWKRKDDEIVMDLRENVNSTFIYLFKVRIFSVWLFFFSGFCNSLQSFIAIPANSGIFSSWLTFAMISSVGYHAHIRRRNFYFPLLPIRKLTGVLSDFSTKVMQLARGRTGNGAQTGSMPKLRPFFRNPYYHQVFVFFSLSASGNLLENLSCLVKIS